MMSGRCVLICLLAVALVSCSKSNNSPAAPSNPTPTPSATTWTLSGTVVDASGGNPLAGATVRIADGPNAGRSGTTTSTGTFTIANLTPAGFTVVASKDAFEDAAQGLTLDTNRTVTFSLRRIGFESGQYLVGSQIAAGRYFADPPGTGCYWERQSGLGGTLSDILANDFVGFNAFQLIVDIASSDLAFETDDECGVWYPTPRHGAQSSIRPGTWLVGNQLPPGVYQANVASGCYWERLSGFSGNLRDIIANDFVSSAGQQLVEIRGSDVGFNSDADCGDWLRVGSSSSVGHTRAAPQSRDDVERNRTLNRRQEGVPAG